jgi:hypothetical protein
MVLAPGPGPACWRPRSYDDGDITPTNEVAMAALHEGGGTLPRPRNMAKPRPIAKVFLPSIFNFFFYLGFLSFLMNLVVILSRISFYPCI